MGIAGLVQIVAKHLGSYLELLGPAASEYRASFRRRIIFALCAVVMAIATLLAAWMTGLALLWDTQWRLTYCGLSVLACLLATTLLATLAAKRPIPGPHGRTLREEAAQDLALLQEWRRAQ